MTVFSNSSANPPLGPPLGEAAISLYAQIIAQAREPAFYRHCGVPDTLDGRFEMICLHVFLVLYRLKDDEGRGDDLAKALFDLVFKDFDQNFREMGVGDLSVGKEVKKMARALLGRIAAYDSALQGEGEGGGGGGEKAPENTEEDPLGGALRRNLYGTAPSSHEYLLSMAAYLRREAQSIKIFPMAELLVGKCHFGPAP